MHQLKANNKVPALDLDFPCSNLAIFRYSDVGCCCFSFLSAYFPSANLYNVSSSYWLSVVTIPLLLMQERELVHQHKLTQNEFSRVYFDPKRIAICNRMSKQRTQSFTAFTHSQTRNGTLIFLVSNVMHDSSQPLYSLPNLFFDILLLRLSFFFDTFFFILLFFASFRTDLPYILLVFSIIIFLRLFCLRIGNCASSQTLRWNNAQTHTRAHRM